VLVVGTTVYITFWDLTPSDMFHCYPPNSEEIDFARVLLAFTMMMSFPLPFFTCREMIIDVGYVLLGSGVNEDDQLLGSLAQAPSPSEDNFLEKLISDADAIISRESIGAAPTTTNTNTNTNATNQPTGMAKYLLVSAYSNSNSNNGNNDTASSNSSSSNSNAENRQLKPFYHVSLTIAIWAAAVGLALEAPSLGSVLDLVGCISGSFIAFILPSMFEVKLRGRWVGKNVFMFAVGVSITVLGSVFSFMKIVDEVRDGGEGGDCGAGD